VTVVFDTNTMLMIVRPGSLTAKDAQGNPITFASERMDGLVKQLTADKNKIVLPTPVLSETLVRCDPAERAEIIRRFNRSSAFRIESFDGRAAIELADMEMKAIAGGDKRGGVEGPWTKIKFDRQIVAIALVAGADVIYTDDGPLSKFAFKHGIRTVGIGALPIPMAAAQMALPYDAPKRQVRLVDDEPADDAGGRIA
jgi:hypothetical protein